MRAQPHHPNRKAHNWLVYQRLNKVLSKHRYCFRGTVVDLGCGETPYKEYILETAQRYIGVDWADTIHELRADVVADLNRPLPLDGAIADTVFSISVLEHLSEPQVMLNEAHRLLKPGGQLLLQVPWQWRVHEEPYDFFRYSPFGLRYLCEKAGFERVEVSSISGFFEMMVLKANYFSLRFVRGPKWLKKLIWIGLWPLWQGGQLLSMVLCRVDRNPMLEASGYFLSAERK